MDEIKNNLVSIRRRIQQAERAYHRTPGSVQLLAVSKGQSVMMIESALKAGQRAFGENYLQEARDKMQALAHHPIEWHFIGTLQANKTRRVAEQFHWVQSVNRARIAERLNAQRPEALPPLNVCIEVNISSEPGKTGAAIEELSALAEAVQRLPRLRLRGLMVIPEASPDFQEQLIIYQKAYTLQQALITQGFPLDTLSMGMSGDFEAAIAAGGTMVRIGTGIFGPRKK